MRKCLCVLLCCLLCIPFLQAYAVSGSQVAADGAYSQEGYVEVAEDYFPDTIPDDEVFDWYRFRLTVTVAGGNISKLENEFTSKSREADSQSYYHEKALKGLQKQVVGKSATVATVNANTVDAVSGATYSYKALQKALISALESADERQVQTYSVTYSLGLAPGTAPETKAYAPGSTVTVPTTPTWENHRFLGWTSTDVTVSGGKFTMPEKNVNLTALWTRPVTATPGSSSMVVADNGSFTISLDFSPLGLTAATGRLLCTVYGNNGCVQSLQSKSIQIQTATELVLQAPQAGQYCQIFLLDPNQYTPLSEKTVIQFISSIANGTYAGSAQCLTGHINYAVDVAVTVQDGKISSITDHTLQTPMSTKDKEFYAKAWDGIVQKLQGTDASSLQSVDAVSGATISSQAIQKAVQNALESQVSYEAPAGELYAPEGISLYARVYPIVTVQNQKITDIRIIPAKNTDTSALQSVLQIILDTQSLQSLPASLSDDAYAVVSLIDQILYGKGVLQ